MVLINDNGLKVKSQKYCLSLLRCFGSKVSDLRVNYTGHNKFGKDKTNHYINQYCADTLISIDFQCMYGFSYRAFQKPLKNVRKVKISLCEFENDQMATLADSFPNVCDLVLAYCIFYSKTASTGISFPHLEHLTLVACSIDKDILMRFAYENAVNLLNANQQLKSLKIRSDIRLSISTLLHAIRQNSSITKLTVANLGRADVGTDVSMDELYRFMNEHPMMAELRLKCYRLTADDASNFISRMKSLLKRFEFQFKDHQECDRFVKQLDNEWKSEISTDDGIHINLSR